jgi:hypothetical protein
MWVGGTATPLPQLVASSVYNTKFNTIAITPETLKRAPHTTASETVGKMKNLFRKLRGKKDDQDGNRRKLNDERERHFVVATTPQDQSLSSLPPQNRNPTTQSAPFGSIVKLAVSANGDTLPTPEELAAVMASPASSPAVGDSKYSFEMTLPLCRVCRNLNASRVPPDGNSTRGPPNSHSDGLLHS